MAGTVEDKRPPTMSPRNSATPVSTPRSSSTKSGSTIPQEISVDLTAPAGVEMHGPTREHVDDDPFQDDPRVVMPFNGMSPSGDVEADVVYANYGTPEDFEKLDKLKVDVRGKIVARALRPEFPRSQSLSSRRNTARPAVIIYSDPADDGWRRGDKYPDGPWRPDTGVQRGSMGYMFEFPGDPTTPGSRVGAVAARLEAHFAATVGADAENSGYAALVSRCLASAAAPRADQTLRASGRARCRSPITSVRARRN